MEGSLKSITEKIESGKYFTMTNYEYLTRLPQHLFESGLMTIFGIEMNEAQAVAFNEWMNSTYNGDLRYPDRMTILLGKMASMLPTEKQGQLKDVMKNYCEVCNYIKPYFTSPIIMQRIFKNN